MALTRQPNVEFSACYKWRGNVVNVTTLNNKYRLAINSNAGTYAITDWLHFNDSLPQCCMCFGDTFLLNREENRLWFDLYCHLNKDALQIKSVPFFKRLFEEKYISKELMFNVRTDEGSLEYNANGQPLFRMRNEMWIYIDGFNIAEVEYKNFGYKRKNGCLTPKIVTITLFRGELLRVLNDIDICLMMRNTTDWINIYTDVRMHINSYWSKMVEEVLKDLQLLLAPLNKLVIGYL
jgi:hypothetical protein